MIRTEEIIQRKVVSLSMDENDSFFKKRTRSEIIGMHVLTYNTPCVRSYDATFYFPNHLVAFGCQKATVNDLLRIKEFLTNTATEEPALLNLKTKRIIRATVIEESEKYFITAKGAFSKEDFEKTMAPPVFKHLKITKDQFYYNNQFVGFIESGIAQYITLIDYILAVFAEYDNLKAKEVTK